MNDRICLACKHFSFDGGSPGYSNMTPGSPMHAECLKGYWHMGAGDYPDAADFFTLNLKAQTCPYFEPSELAIKHGWKA